MDVFSKVKIFTLKFLVQNIRGIFEDEPCLDDYEKQTRKFIERNRKQMTNNLLRQKQTEFLYAKTKKSKDKSEIDIDTHLSSSNRSSISFASCSFIPKRF